MAKKLAVLSFDNVEVHLATTRPTSELQPHAPLDPARQIADSLARAIVAPGFFSVDATRRAHERAWKELLPNDVDVTVVLSNLQPPFVNVRDWRYAEASESAYEDLYPPCSALREDELASLAPSEPGIQRRGVKVERWKCESLYKTTTRADFVPDSWSVPADSTLVVIDPIPIGVSGMVSDTVRKARSVSPVVVAYRAPLIESGKKQEELTTTLGGWARMNGDASQPIWIVTSVQELADGRALPRRPLSWSELRDWLDGNSALKDALALSGAGLVVHLGSRGVAVLDRTRATDPVEVFAWHGVLPCDETPWFFTAVPGMGRTWIANLCRTLLAGATANDRLKEFAENGLVDARLHDTFGMQRGDGSGDSGSATAGLVLPTRLVAKYRADNQEFLVKRIRRISPGLPTADVLLDAIENRLRDEKSIWPVFTTRIGGLEVPDIGGTEIESLLALQRQIRSYVEDGKRSKPLNLLVLGSPGSGKSFVVKELLTALSGFDKHSFSTINMTQATTSQALWPEFDKLRSRAIRGLIGVLFVDEFDTVRRGVKLGWLSHFLGPMQDGEYSGPSGVQPLGRCLLVFAGGTIASLEEFDREAASGAGKEAKAPDFRSRIHAAHDVPGIHLDSDESGGALLRRAILVAHQLRAKWPGVRSADRELLRALLQSEYRHGARSLEFVIQSLDAKERAVIGLSALPARRTLDLHVTGGPLLESHPSG